MVIISHLSMSSIFPTHTANGRIFVLPLIEYIFSMACVSRAEAVKPYMVSVGTATTPPLSNNVTHSLTVSNPSLVLSIFRGTCPSGAATKLMIHIKVNKISDDDPVCLSAMSSSGEIASTWVSHAYPIASEALGGIFNIFVVIIL